MAKNNPRSYFSQIANSVADRKPRHFRWHVAGDTPDAPRNRLTRDVLVNNALGELASVAEVLRDLDGRSRRRSESGSGADAALAHLDHDGHLRAVRSGRTEASSSADEPDDRVEEKQAGRNEGDVMHGTNSIVTFCDVTRASDLQPVLISKELLVELVGIEPTTSSLRILNSVRDGVIPKKRE